jgi:hypothetical protein
MSNIHQARGSIKAEIENCKAGVLHYRNKVDQLEQLQILLDGISSDVVQTNRKERKATASSTAKGLTLRKDGKRKLPSTKIQFWLGLLSDRPQSHAELLEAAISRLNITPDFD